MPAVRAWTIPRRWELPVKRALQDRGASAGDEGDSGGSAWPPAILFSMAIAHCTSLFSSLSYCIRLF